MRPLLKPSKARLRYRLLQLDRCLMRGLSRQVRRQELKRRPLESAFPLKVIERVFFGPWPDLPFRMGMPLGLSLGQAQFQLSPQLL